jgi:NAD(P)H-dependent FMN reductase
MNIDLILVNMEDSSIDNGSNISGISLLLNMEKISNGVDIDDMERKVKSMYVEADDEPDAEEEEEDVDILDEYEQAMDELESNVEEEEEEEEKDEEPDDNDDIVSVISRANTVRSNYIPDPKDALYTYKTRDDQLQSSINLAMESVPKMNLDIDQEIENERRNSLLSQIEALRDDLQELGVSVDSPQYMVSYTAPLKQIEEVNRRLTFKYNKLKYNSIAEEALVAGASLLEMIFNGQHEYFGCKPDITGYSDVVKSKLKRIRVETSTAVSQFVAANNVGIIPRLMMELLPSLITQSQRRKLQANDSLNASMGYRPNSVRGHISDLNNM